MIPLGFTDYLTWAAKGVMIRPNYMPEHLALRPRPTVVNYDDMIFLHEIGALDWDYAATMCFQQLIHSRGTPEEKQRLRDLKLGYWG